MYKGSSIILGCLLGSQLISAQNVKTEPINGAPQNIIIILANGMGMNQVQAASLKKGSPVSFSNFPVLGFSQPWPVNGKMPSDSTLSIAVGTNKSESTGKDFKSQSLFSLAKDKKMLTGIITTESVTGSTTKNFVIDNPNKKDGEALALDYLNSNIDVIIGGGSQYFDKRYDGRNLFKDFRAKGYNTEFKLSGLNRPSSSKTIAILEKDGIYRASARKDFLSKSALFAAQSMMGSGGSLILINDTKIAEADSLNNTPFLMEEMLDLDKLVSDLTTQTGGQTLIIVIGNC